MKPEIFDYVVIIFKNSIKVEGKVSYWSEKKVILESFNDTHNIIVINNFDDVLAYKIIKPLPQKKDDHLKDVEIEEPLQEPVKHYNDSVNEVKEVSLPRKDDGSLDLQSLASLRKMQAEEEKQNIINKLRSHQIGEMKAVKYDVPRFFKK